MTNNLDLEAQWAQEMDNMSMISDTSINSEAEFYNLINTRKQEHHQSLMKRKTDNQKILNHWKDVQENNRQQIQQFEDELPELKRIIQNQDLNVIEESKIQSIRENLTVTISLVKEEQQPIYEEVEMEQEVQIMPVLVVKEEDNRNKQKMERMFEERELIEMHREDQRSMKYQKEYQKSMFNQRFFTPELKTVRQKAIPIEFTLPVICYTYTNLAPQMNNQTNTFSKHSPVIALQNLKRLVKRTVKPSKSILNQITVTQKIKVEGVVSVKHQIKTVQLPHLSEAILSHFNNFSKSISKLEQISKNYQSKFVNDHLDEEERGQNFTLTETDSKQTKSLDSFLETVVNYQKMKELKITFENLADIKYIQTLKNLEYVYLKHNKLTSVEPIINNQNIIELNLSYNKINSMQGIQYLKNLRYLNLQHNQIQTIIDLQCPYLQILILNNNGIRRVTGLNKTFNLRTLDVSSNKLEDLRGLANQYFLNNLNAQNNKIEEVKGIENCLLLKNLILNKNNISFIEPLAYIFLHKLSLSNNSLTAMPEMFLPSLEQFYIDYNKLKDVSFNLFIPRLKKINLDHNKFAHFSPIWNLLKNSSHCQFIKYDNNQQLSFLSVAINEVYEFMIFKKMNNLQILNQNPYNIGTRRYFESQYGDLLKSSNEFNDHGIAQLSSQITSIITQNRFIESVEREKHQFRKDSDFIHNKSINMVQNIKKIFRLVKGKDTVFVQMKSVFYKYDLYGLKKKAALEKIRSIVVRQKYRKEKRRKYFQKNKQAIKAYLIRIIEDSKIYNLRKVVNKFSSVFGENNKHASMNKIKHCYRRYKDRIKFIKLIDNLRANKKNSLKFQEEEEFEEINLDFLDKNYDYSTRITVPSHMNFENLIYRPQVFQKAQEIVENAMIYQQSDTSSRHASMQNTSSTYNNQNQSFNKLSARFNKSKKKSLPPINYKEETQKVIQAMRLEGEVTEKVRMQIEEGIRQKHRRKAENKKEEKYAYQKMQKISSTMKKF